VTNPSNAMPEARIASETVARADISAAHRFYWSVRRELWEYRSIYIAPLAAAAIFLVGFLIGMVHLPGKIRAGLALDAMRQNELLQQPYHFSELLLMATFLIVAGIYCLDALYGERRDRSILFWKSLPVSDFTTVLAKACIPIVILPLVAFVITVITQCIMTILSSAVLVANGLHPAILLNHLPLFRMWSMLFAHIVGFHGFWYAPIYCWFLFVSAWARRAPFLWATLPLLTIGVVEKIAFDTSHFGALLRSRFAGGPESQSFTGTVPTMDAAAHLHSAQFLISPGLWIGLAVAAAFLAGAVRLRRYRGPL